ncbi:MAG: hypothetical protein Q4A78_00530 [Peptostreptococcaceae bacterium]|nr:hypothetical protein [Peptostreptococcaceae bacterium]
MSDSLKIRYEAFAPVEARIYDKSGKLVAYGKGLRDRGFDRDTFIYDSFSDEERKPLVSIYMPRRGYKLVLTSGNTEGVPVNLSITTSTLTPDGDFDVSVRQVVPLTQKGGVIATIDGTEEPILSENIADKLAGEVTRYYTDWTGEEVLRMNLHEKRQTPITGKEAEAVRPLLHYDTSDETIVSVSEEGLLTATGYGEAIVFTSDGNKVYSSLVIVMRKADSVSLPDVDMVIGERTLIRPHFTPASTTEREMHYTVSEEGIIEINEQGVMLALRPGVVQVTGTTDYGLTGSFTVQVTDGRLNNYPNSSGRVLGFRK